MSTEMITSIVAEWEVLGEDGVIRSIQNLAKRSKSALDPRLITDQWNAVLPKVGEKFRDTMKSAIRGGLDIKEVARFTESFSQLKGKMQGAIEKVAEIEGKLAQENLGLLEKARLKSQLKAQNQQVAAQQASFAADMRHVKRISERREEAMKDAAEILNRNMAEGVEAFGEGISNSFGKLKSGDIGGLFKGAGKGVQGRGMAMQKGQMAQMKFIGPLVQKMGGLLTKIGPALMAIGAIAGGLALIAKLVMDADAHVKTFNKDILEAGVTVGDLEGGMKNLTKATGDLMEAFEGGDMFGPNQSLALKWGLDTKELAGIYGGLGKIGQGMDRLVGGVAAGEDRVKALRTEMSRVVIYAKLLGESGAEMADKMGEYMEDLGLTLEGIQRKFGTIYGAAMESGFGVKRFFNMVLQATSGMSMYNVRIEEAASLMLQLSKILGMKAGGEFFDSMKNKANEMDAKERSKRMRVVGRGTMTKDVRAMFRTQLGDFLQAAKDVSEKKGMSLQQGLAKIGLGNFDADKLRSGDKDETARLEKFMQGMTEAQVRAMKTSVRTGLDETMSAPIRQLIDLGKGTAGTYGALMKAMDSFTATGNIAFESSYLESLLKMGGFKDIGQAQQSELGRHMLEEFSQRTGKNLTQLTEALEGFKGNFEALNAQRDEVQALVKSIGLAGGSDTEAGRVLIAQLREMQAKQAKDFQAFVNDNGEVVRGALREDGTVEELGGPIKDSREYLLAIGEGQKATEQVMSKQAAAAEAVVKHTRDMAAHLQQLVQHWMAKLFSLVNDLFNGLMDLVAIVTQLAIKWGPEGIKKYLPEVTTTTQRRKWSGDIDARRARAEAMREEGRQIARQLAEAQHELTSEKDPGKREALQERIDGLKAGMGITEERAKRTEAQAEAIRSVGAFEYAADEAHERKYEGFTPEAERNIRANQALDKIGYSSEVTSEKMQEMIATWDRHKASEDRAKTGDRKKDGEVYGKAGEPHTFKAVDKALQKQAIREQLTKAGITGDVGKFADALIKGDVPEQLRTQLQQTDTFDNTQMTRLEYFKKMGAGGLGADFWTPESVNDAVWMQTGQGWKRVDFHPDDVLSATKGGPPTVSGGGSGIIIHNHFPSDKAVASVRRFMEHDIRYVRG
jgi:hypothetical protein